MAFVMFNGVTEGDTLIGIQDMVFYEDADAPEKIEETRVVEGEVVRDSFLTLKEFSLLVEKGDLNVLTSLGRFDRDQEPKSVAYMVAERMDELEYRDKLEQDLETARAIRKEHREACRDCTAKLHAKLDQGILP